MGDEGKSMVDRVIEAAETAVARMQQEVTQSPVLSATRERAQQVRSRAQTAVTQLPLATADDVARIQASLDRIEAAVNDIARELRDMGPAEPSRGQLSTGMEDAGEGGEASPPIGPP
jgi:hypothetical protein